MTLCVCECEYLSSDVRMYVRMSLSGPCLRGGMCVEESLPSFDPDCESFGCTDLERHLDIKTLVTENAPQ